MRLGLFMPPAHPPERSTFDAHQWDLDVIALADELGYEKAWVGEHLTAAWEPVPAPDLLIAQALMRTRRIKLGPGGHMLPYHNPVELAHRVAYLDHLAQGRLMLCIGSGSIPTDMQIFGVDPSINQHREMAREALELMLKVWEAEGPLEFKGKYWQVKIPDPNEFAWANFRVHRRPFQKPHPPIGVAAASVGSETLKIAGEKGYIPMSLGMGAAYLGSHWEAVLEGAKRANRTPPSRSQWRIVRDVWVADTDEEAQRGAREGMLFRAWREYFHPLVNYGPYPLIRLIKHDTTVPDEAVNLEYLMEHVWLVGSPETVARKIRGLYKASGGFGVLLAMVLDHSGDQRGWERAMRLLAEEVMPRVGDLTGEPAAARRR
jgi:alkanesulfonate monooxygenase SsuD/methylene tetrahydromethanopterin reductase-like flavin-dependent oxidoreductase (luciferase family)